MRKNVRKLLVGLGEIQGLISKAKFGYLNDRAKCRASIVIPALEKAFDLCVKLRSDYPPIEMIDNKK